MSTEGTTPVTKPSKLRRLKSLVAEHAIGFAACIYWDQVYNPSLTEMGLIVILLVSAIFSGMRAQRAADQKKAQSRS